MAQINLNAVLNFDDSQFKKGVKSTQQELKKFSTAPAFIKLKLDEKDFRREYQELFKDLHKKIEKSGALSYKTASGKTRIADTEKTMERAYTYNLQQSMNSKLSTVERSAYAKRAVYMQQYLNLLKEIGLETARQTQLEKEHANMGLRMEKARLSGAVEAERRRAAAAKKAITDIPNIERDIKQLEKERGFSKDIIDNSKQLNKEISIVGKLINKYDSYLNKLKLAGADESLIKGVRRKVASLREEHERLKRNRIALDNYNKQTREAKRLDDVLNRQGNLLNRLGNLASRYFSIYSVVNFGQKVAEITGYFEQQKIAMEGILGSASEAQRIVNGIKSMALESPMQTKDLVTYTKQLSAFGVQSKDLLKTTKSLADISVGLGVDMSRIILAYGQVKSATVLRGQELRQFTEAGIPMVDALAKKLTALNGELVTTADVFELISKRQVSFDVVSSVLNDMTAEGGQFYKMQERLTNTLAGQISKLKDIWTLSLEDIGKEAKGMFVGIVKMLQVLAKNAKTAAAALLVMVTGSMITRGIKNMQMEFMALDIRMRKLIGNWRKLAMMRIGKSLAGFGISAGISAIVAGLVKWYHEATKVKKVMSEIADSFNAETRKMTEGLDSLFRKLMSAPRSSQEWQDAFDALKTNYSEFVNVNDPFIQSLSNENAMLDAQIEKYRELNTLIVAAIELRQREALYNEQLSNAARLVYEKAKSNNEHVSYGIRNKIWNYSQDGIGIREDFINSLFGENYENRRDAAIDLQERLVQSYNRAMAAFLNERKTTREEFLELYKNELNSEFLGNKFSDTQYQDFFRSLISDAGAEFRRLSDDREFENYLNLIVNIDNSSLLSSKRRIDEIFKRTKLKSVQSGSKLAQYDERAGFYKDIFREGLLAEINAIAQNSPETTDALNNLNSVLDNSESSVTDIYEALNTLFEAFSDPSKRSVMYDLARQYKEGVDILTDTEEIISASLRDVEDFKDEAAIGEGINKYKAQDYFESFFPELRGNATVEQTRKKISDDYKSLKSDLETYQVRKERASTSTEKDAFDVEIKKIESKIRVLEKLAGYDYYRVNLTSGQNGEQLPTELSDFITELKTAYTRYKEASQKGGGIAGVDYVKNDTAFNKEFGEFFHGVESELFNKLSNITVGEKSAFDILKDKFISGGLEDGILGFEDAVRAVADELTRYGELDKENRKAYINVGKQLEKWADNTFSKDKLNSALKNLESELKNLTNTFKNTTQTVELYRKLQQNGTADTVGLMLGSGSKDNNILKELDRLAATPDSRLQKENILNIIGAFNKEMPDIKFELNDNDLVGIENVNKVIEKLDALTKMNNGAFSASPLGQNTDMVKKLLEDLIQTMIREMSELSGEVYTGDKSSDMEKNMLTEYNSLLKAAVRTDNIAKDNRVTDTSAIKKIVEQVQTDASTYFEQFMSDNRLDLVAGKDGMISKKELEELENKLRDISKDFPEALRDELLSKITTLRSKVDEYNASIGAYTNFGKAIKGYRGAKDYAKKQYDDESTNNKNLRDKLKAHEDKTNILSDEELVKVNAELALSEERLKSMGVDGIKLKEELQKISLENLTKSVDECRQQFDSMANIVRDVLNAAKAFSKAINHVYDVMNDGENPEWMQDMDGFLNDFGETFEALAAPMIAIISLVSTLTIAITVCESACVPLLVALAVVIAVAAVVAGIVAAVQQHDRALQRTIENLEKQIEDTQNAIKNLNDEAERTVGWEKQKKSFEAMAESYKAYVLARAKYSAENAKDNTNNEELAKLAQEAEELKNEYLNQIHELREGILFSVEDLAGSISDALRSAFQNGTNAARDMAAAIKESIGDIVQNMITMTIIKPQIEKLMEDFFGGSVEQLEAQYATADGMDWEGLMKYLIERANNPEALKALEDGAKAVGDNSLEFLNSIGSTLKDYFSFNGSASGMSGGISGITEDTARQLEGLNNSMLMQLVMINQGVTLLYESPFANIQTSWFRDVLEQAKATRVATENLNKLVSSMNDPGSRSLRVTVI